MTPEQGELLVEELKRFEPHLEPVADWFEDLEPRPQESIYGVGETEVRLLRVEGGLDDIVAGWSISWLEDLDGQTAEELAIKTEHRHRISVAPTGHVPYSSYERIDWLVDLETGRLERIRSGEEREAIRAFHAEGSDAAAVRAFTESIYAEIDRVREMERITGVDTRGFTTERFDKVMSLLAQIADPADKKL